MNKHLKCAIKLPLTIVLFIPVMLLGMLATCFQGFLWFSGCISMDKPPVLFSILDWWEKV